MSNTTLSFLPETRRHEPVLDHDHAWRLDRSSRTDPAYDRPPLYRCDLCQAVWST